MAGCVDTSRGMASLPFRAVQEDLLHTSLKCCIRLQSINTPEPTSALELEFAEVAAEASAQGSWNSVLQFVLMSQTAGKFGGTDV